MKLLKITLVAVVLVSVAVLLYLSYDSAAQLPKRTPPLTEETIKGKVVWQRNNCINCHTILGNGAYFAPDLTKVAAKRNPQWLTGFLTSPGKVWPGTVMAGISLNNEDARNLTAFLTWVNGIDTNGWPPEPVVTNKVSSQTGQLNNSNSSGDSGAVNKGRTVFESQGCSGCHQVNGAGGSAGPDLSAIGGTRDETWLNNFLKDPQKVKPGIMMSAPDISEEELSALTEYLESLK